MPVAVAVGIGVALLVAALLAITAGSSGSPRSVRFAAGGPLTVWTAGMAYVIVLVGTLSSQGITLVSTIVLAVMAILPGAAGRVSRNLCPNAGPTAAPVLGAASVTVALSLVTALLATAGGLLSLIGDVNRYVAIAAIGICCAVYLLARGRQGANRTSRWSIVFGVFAIVVLGVGLAVASPSVLVNPIVPYAPTDWWGVAAMAIAVVAMGIFDPVLRLAIRDAAAATRTVVIGSLVLVVFVAFMGIGSALFFGGATVAPSLQFLTVFAVLPAIVLGVLLCFVTFLFAAISDSLLAAGSEIAVGQSTSARQGMIIFLAVGSIVVAMVFPNPEGIMMIGALIACASLGALVPSFYGGRKSLRPIPPVVVGVVAAVVVGFILDVQSEFRFTGRVGVVLIVAIGAAAIVSALTSRTATAAQSTAECNVEQSA